MQTSWLRTKRTACLAIAFLTPVLCPPSTFAANIVGSETAAPFGNLNQNAKDAQNNFLLDCHSVACAPASVVNAFVYIQNLRPGLYSGNKQLVGANKPITMADLVSTANTLGDNYMKSCDACFPNAPGGTTIEDTMIGKQNYLQDFSPGTTTLSMMDFYAWNASANIQNQVAQPAYVTAGTAPTAQFIANALNANAAVEAYLLYASGRAAHYVTLTAINFNPANNTGTAAFVDPLTGGAVNVNITGLSAGNLNTDYSGGASIRAVYVETPVPEPATLAFMAAASLLALLARRRYSWR